MKELFVLALVPRTSTLLCCLGAGDDLGMNMKGIGSAVECRPFIEFFEVTRLGVGVGKTLSSGVLFTRLAVDGVALVFGSPPTDFSLSAIDQDAFDLCIGACSQVVRTGWLPFEAFGQVTFRPVSCMSA